MNIDKFGHHVHKRLRLTEYIDTLNDYLVKSDTGYYDLKSSKLKGLSFPNEDDEAVNKAYMDKTVEEIRKEIQKVNNNVKNYLNSLEKVTLNRISTLYYTKTEIDNLIEAKLKAKLTKNE